MNTNSLAAKFHLHFRHLKFGYSDLHPSCTSYFCASPRGCHLCVSSKLASVLPSEGTVSLKLPLP